VNEQSDVHPLKQFAFVTPQLHNSMRIGGIPGEGSPPPSPTADLFLRHFSADAPTRPHQAASNLPHRWEAALLPVRPASRRSVSLRLRPLHHGYYGQAVVAPAPRPFSGELGMAATSLMPSFQLAA